MLACKAVVNGYSRSGRSSGTLGSDTKESAMIKRINIFDRIMMPALLLASLYILMNSYIVGESSIDNPVTAQWVLLVVGVVYVLYQAIRIGSPLLTFTSAAVVLVGCLGPLVVHMRFYLRNYYWEPLGSGFTAIAVIALMLAILWLPVVAAAFVAWIVQRKRKNTITD
jgi:hypothetical protein